MVSRAYDYGGYDDEESDAEVVETSPDTTYDSWDWSDIQLTPEQSQVLTDYGYTQDDLNWLLGEYTRGDTGMSDAERLIREGETGTISTDGMSDAEKLIREGETGVRPSVGAPSVSDVEKLIKTGETGARTGGARTGGARPAPGGILGQVKSITDAIGLTNPQGSVNPFMLAGLAGLLGMAGKGSTPAPTGYQGTIPKYTAVRQMVDIPQDPNRRPGSGGRRYFSDLTYAKQTDVPAALKTAQAQALALKPALTPAPVRQEVPKNEVIEAPKKEVIEAPNTAQAASRVIDRLPVPQYAERERIASEEPIGYTPDTISAARGGLMNLAKGRYLNGATDGMADKIPATIEDRQPARLSHGEFVIPADVVSHLGNGNSNAGAERLYNMMERIRKARTGNAQQGKQVNPNKFLPA